MKSFGKIIYYGSKICHCGRRVPAASLQQSQEQRKELEEFYAAFTLVDSCDLIPIRIDLLFLRIKYILKLDSLCYLETDATSSILSYFKKTFTPKGRSKKIQKIHNQRYLHLLLKYFCKETKQ